MIHLLPIEPIESRYTSAWWHLIPVMLKDGGLDVTVYEGKQVQSTIGNSSDFLSWIPTNIFKSSQLTCLAEAFQRGEVKDGDVVFITDFWNPSVINIKYMIDLCGLDVKLVGYAHAGRYDKWDRLGQTLKNNQWENIERGIFSCYDKIIFATEFHRELFEQTYGVSEINVVAGFFGNYIEDNRKTHAKGNKIVFCQRNAVEKQPHLFYELQEKAKHLNLEWVDLSKNPLPNHLYIKEIQSAKYVISFALQETLGIVPFEALSNGCCIIVPDRLSYSEMYTDDVKYDGTVDSALSKLEHLEKLTKEQFSVIIDENYKKSLPFFDGRSTVNLLKEL